MNWIDIMERAQAMPQTAEEWFVATSDAIGITVTLLWMGGVQQVADSFMHTCIAMATLASVSFSFYIKVKTYRKEQKDRKKDRH